MKTCRSFRASPFLGMLFSVVVVAGAAGCGGAPGAAGPKLPDENVSVVVSREPGVVELMSAKAVVDAEKVAHFEVGYKFTSGKPVKHYTMQIAFVGVEHGGIKPIDYGTLKPEGVIKTGIEVGDRPVKDFEITFSEADSPDAGYTVISNTLQGSIAPPTTPDPAGG